MNATKKRAGHTQPTDDAATKTIHLRVSPAELVEIQRRALAADMSVSAYLRHCALYL